MTSKRYLKLKDSLSKPIRRFKPLRTSQALHSYEAFMALCLMVLFFLISLRIYESLVVNYLFNPNKLWKSEALGMIMDLMLAIGILGSSYPLYKFLFRQKNKLGIRIFENTVFLFIIGHLIILEYFFYQMRPLDIFLFNHQPSEVAFSYATSGVTLRRVLIALFLSILLWTVLQYSLKSIRCSSKWFKYSLLIGIAFISLFSIYKEFAKIPVSRDLFTNKSFHFYSKIVLSKTSRYFEPPVESSSLRYQEQFPREGYINSQYPFLHQFNDEDNFGPLLNKFKSPPNIVILITESLSEYFLHPIRGVHFMPFLDSLSKESLYWSNFLTLGERSFAANPCLSASLPYGEMGFTLMQTYPYHFSLMNVLNKNNYLTSFYYGQGAWFHNKKHFYQFNNTGRIIDKDQFQKIFSPISVGEERYVWGYNDIDLFRQYLISTDSLINKPRLDILFTGTSHSPFIIKDSMGYHEKYTNAVAKLKNKSDKIHFEKYKRFYLTLYNVDDAYKILFEEFKKRPDFENTIFILTGDHPMTELPIENAFTKYKVPMIIYSPKLKEKKHFESFSSHLDIYETILAYLKKNYKLETPQYSTALGSKINFSESFDTKGEYAFMNDNRQIVDFYSNGYYLYNEKYLFKVNKDMRIREIYDKVLLDKMKQKLIIYRAASKNASLNFKLMPDSLFFNFFNQKVLLNQYRTDTIRSNNAKFPITEIDVDNKKSLFLDLSLNRISDAESFPQISYEWKDSCDSCFNKTSLYFPYDQINFQYHIKIDYPEHQEHGSKLHLYFENPKKNHFEFAKLKCVVYTQ
ncbi:MAG: sulfatase-like hydrolase/transferase [Saprospiraceae bacterium]|nr:sulfatase-like hydrolase/transferase [Candidatus Vicinibacter proximus]MCC6842116.1 sulfatase-like hydrolase/transferase [Saprospiraceae bacterium]